MARRRVIIQGRKTSSSFPPFEHLRGTRVSDDYVTMSDNLRHEKL